MKASDISDYDMLEAIRRCNGAECDYPMDAGYHGGRPGYGFDPGNEKGHWAMWTDLCRDFPDAPPKVVLAKLRRLIDRKLTNGCGCGCRGDFELTNEGREFLAARNSEGEAA